MNQSAEWNVIMGLNDAQKAMAQMEAIVNIVVVTHLPTFTHKNQPSMYWS